MKKIIQTIAGVIGMLCIMAAGVYAEEINVGYEFSDMDYQEAVFDEQMYEGQWVDVDTHIQLFLPLEWTTEDIEEYKESNGELLFGASFGRNTTLSVLGEDHFRKEMVEEYGHILDYEEFFSVLFQEDEENLNELYINEHIQYIQMNGIKAVLWSDAEYGGEVLYFVSDDDIPYMFAFQAVTEEMQPVVFNIISSICFR